MSKRAIVLCNLGTPESPTPQKVRAFLKPFLSDQRVVELPKFLWLPFLYGVVLPLRCKRVAKAYDSIWWPQGSPLAVITQRQVAGLAKRLETQGSDITVTYCMAYSSPSLPSVLADLQAQKVEDVFLLPMYPQYSATTTAVIYDQLAQFCLRQRKLPSVRVLRDYHEHELYITALVNSVLEHREEQGANECLLFSFHGLPEVNIEKGDPYQQQCLRTAELTASQLGLHVSQWRLSFQSRFGKQKWVQPYTSTVLNELAVEGVGVDVICPAFSADCLETLEEIKIEAAKQYKQAGGQTFSYISCLNDRSDHLDMLEKIVVENF